MDVKFSVRETETRVRRLTVGTPSRTAVFLYEKWVTEDLSRNFSGQIEFAGDVVKLLGEPLDVDVVRQSCMSVFTGTIILDDLIDLCWRIAGNVDLLRANHVLPARAWVYQPLLAPLQIFHAQCGWSRARVPRKGTLLTFRVLCGEACPLKFSRWFSDRFLFRLAKEFGIGNYRAKHKFSGNRLELVGMRFVVTLIKSKYDLSAITFERYAVGQFTSYNKRLLKLRHTPCPLGHKWECHECSLAAGPDACPVITPLARSCRPVTLELQLCNKCKDNTFWDGNECIKCRESPLVPISFGKN